MPTTNFTQEIKARLLRLLADGKSAGDVAEILDCQRDQVVAIARNHGYPDVDKLSWAADIMQKNLEGLPTPPPPEPARPSHQPLATVGSQPLGIADLLRGAKAHPSKRIQAAAEHVVERLDKLRALIAEDDEKNAEKRRAKAARDAAQAEVKRLEQQLADAKAKLRPARKPANDDVDAVPPTSEPSAAVVRAWAKTAGVDCPKAGQVPKTVRTAYADAQIQEAS